TAPAQSSDPETARRARTRPPRAPPPPPPAPSRHGSHRQPVHRTPRLHHHARPLRRAGHHRVIELAHRQRTHRRPARRQRLHTPRQPRRQPGRVHPVVHHLAHRRRTIGIHQHRQLRHQTAALLQHVEHRRLPQPPPVQVRGIQEIGDVVDVPLLLERVQNRVVGIEPRIGLQQLLTHLIHPAHPHHRQPRGRRSPRQVGHPPVPALPTPPPRPQPGGPRLIHLRQARRPHHTPVPALPGPPPGGPHQRLHHAQLLLADRTATRRTGDQLHLQRRQRPLHVRLTVAPIRLQQRRPPHQLEIGRASCRERGYVHGITGPL